MVVGQTRSRKRDLLGRESGSQDKTTVGTLFVQLGRVTFVFEQSGGLGPRPSPIKPVSSTLSDSTGTLSTGSNIVTSPLLTSPGALTPPDSYPKRERGADKTKVSRESETSWTSTTLDPLGEILFLIW